MAEVDSGNNAYVLGHSERELERLRLQAKLIDPITRQFLVEAGIGPGMRVLDIGSGAGDVTFLAANLVGPGGNVVGVDRSPAAIDRARAWCNELSIIQVTFHQSELSAMPFDEPFDAVIGRYVLCFQPDPAALLRAIAKQIRPGGIVVFHEPDRELMHSVPPAPIYDRACRWVSETYRRSGVDVRMGIKLYPTFLAAGLPAPTMRLHAVIGGANALDEVHLDADSLVERIIREVAANQSVIIGRAEIGAWSRLPI